MPVTEPKALIEERVLAIREFHRRLGVARAQLDVSGGIDSGTMLGLLARALGPKNVIAVYSSIHSSNDSRDRAREAAVAFDVQLIEVDLSEIFDQLVARMRRGLEATGHAKAHVDARIEKDPTVLGSLRSCIRAPIGRGFNRLGGGGIRHGTGNECEDRWLRFYQKGGDGEVDTNPIAMLSKGEVYQLARALTVPASLITALPTPDLHGIGDAHNDEDELLAATGVAWTYSRIDPRGGEYTRVGTIERLSRCLDLALAAREERDSLSLQSLLFGPHDPEDRDWEEMVATAMPMFGSMRGSVPASAVQVEEFLRSARRIEAATRHKANPNCPALGDRDALVRAGILDDTLTSFST